MGLPCKDISLIKGANGNRNPDIIPLDKLCAVVWDCGCPEERVPFLISTKVALYAGGVCSSPALALTLTDCRVRKVQIKAWCACSLSLSSSLVPDELVIRWKRNVDETGMKSERSRTWRDGRSCISIRLVTFLWRIGFVNQIMQAEYVSW